MENLNSKIEISQPKDEKIDDIDFRLFLNLLLRNKAIIGSISLITLILGIIYSFTVKEIWAGQFQIVLNKGSKPFNINSQLANLAGINLTKENELETEVEILKSPSVLMPVFEFAKLQNDQLALKTINFSTWKRNTLSFELGRNTSILNITYKNTNKKAIIPVLNKMSNSYQEYSGKTKRRSEELTINFLKEQIAIFKKKSANSLKAAQEYAISQDLVFYDFGKLPQNNINKIPQMLTRNTGVQAPNYFNIGLDNDASRFQTPNLFSIGIENVRVKAANQIRKIDLQLQKIKELNNTEELQYIGSTIPALVEEGLPKALSDIEAALLEARLKYTDQDISIVNLIKKRNRAIDLLKNRIIKYLEIQKLDSEATMKAATRPKGVLLKYKELTRESSRDEQTLIQLEDKFNLFKLDAANKEDPWELITNPTLLENRVSPNRKRIVLLSLIIGFIVGTFFAVSKERKSGKIYDYSQIEKFIPIKLISKINLSQLDLEAQNLLFIKDLLNKESSNMINFVPIGNIEAQELENLKKSLINKKLTKDLKFSSIEENIKEYPNYLIIKLGYINYSDIFILQKRLELVENDFNGLIVLTE